MKRPLKLLLKSILLLFLFLNIVVIFHAYKLTHFYNREDLAVKNKTSRTRWDTVQDILMGPKAVKQLNQQPDTIVQTIYFETSDHLKLEAWYLPSAGNKGTVAMFHGHGGKKSSLLPEAANFRKLGYHTLLLDFRAHGNSEGNTCTIGQDESEDVKLVYDYLKKNNEKNIMLYGVSMGAATIMKSIDEYDLTPSKVILEMPFGSLFEAVEGRLRIMHLPPQPLATMLTFWGGTTHGFWAFNLNPVDYAKSIKCPVLLQWGKLDPRVSEAETNGIYQNIPGTKKLVVYEQSAHESLFKKEPEKWTNETTAFLQ